MNKIVEIPIDILQRATYNPRYISEDKIKLLSKSIEIIGMVKPIIVRSEDMRILAGHQRSRAILSSNKTSVPAFILTGVNSTDEVRFNQLHNLSECEISDRAPLIKVRTENASEGRFCLLEAKDIEIISPGEKNQAVNQLSKLILKYGQFASVVINSEGEVIVSAVYAKAVKLLNQPLWVYKIPVEKEEKVKYFFSKEYGVFSYNHIEKHTYIQSLAQRYRLRGEDNGTRSTLYRKLVIPFIQNLSKEKITILDFGAGQRDYAKMLQDNGYKVHTIEFYLRKPGKDIIWVEEINNDFEKIVTQLTLFGQYDIVVCDSVLNSVDSLEAQNSVLATLSALCKENGHVFWSGIPLKFKKKHIDRKNTYDPKESSAFLDSNGFTGNYRYGEWYFQKYHSMKDVIELTNRFLSNQFKIYDKGDESKVDRELIGSSFQVHAINKKPLRNTELEKALEFEFSLPLPNNKKYQFAPRLIEAYRKSIINENRKNFTNKTSRDV